jgi:hypothetical protein
VEIRGARPGDERAVVAFLRAEDPHDYVFDWMAQFRAQGRFFVLWDGRRIAGVVHGKRAPDGSAWMSVARVNKDYRGQGWINRMNERAVGSVPLRHAHAARMLITDDNASSRRAADKGGFRIVSTMTFMDWDVPKRRRGPLEPSGYRKAAPAAFLKAARGSRALAAQGGLAYMSFNGSFALNARSARAARPWLFTSDEHGALLAGMFVGGGERWMAAQPLGGGSAVARAVQRFAAERRAEAVTAILPAHAAAHRPFKAAGYTVSKWARRVHVYAKALRPDRPTF